jgi:hypothetical protein
MRIRVQTTMILTVLAIAASCLLPGFAQPVQIGGDYGKNWLVNNGDRSVVREPSGDLWSWGTVPKGQYLTNGVLESIGASTIYYPSFLENSTPIVLNSTANLAGYFPPDFSSPDFLDDPWFLAQLTGRPVIVH